MNAWERQTIAHMERQWSHDARMKNVGPALIASACLGGFAAFVLFILWLVLVLVGIL